MKHTLLSKPPPKTLIKTARNPPKSPKLQNTKITKEKVH